MYTVWSQVGVIYHACAWLGNWCACMHMHANACAPIQRRSRGVQEEEERRRSRRRSRRRRRGIDRGEKGLINGGYADSCLFTGCLRIDPCIHHQLRSKISIYIYVYIYICICICIYRRIRTASSFLWIVSIPSSSSSLILYYLFR